MKKIGIFLSMAIFLSLSTQAQTYKPTAENIAARKVFDSDRFGLFIHWGPFSILGQGEWVMNNLNIQVDNYKRLMTFFDPVYFNADQWVAMAKDAGMKYITLITRHHDGFSMWNTQYSDFNIMHTPYGKDVVKEIADACHRQGIQLFLYYSLLDWGREDYPHETGRTGQGTGRKGHGDYPAYLKFMENQLTELLTHYGKIAGIWFDGYWDQTPPEGAKDRTSRIDWHLDEIYSLIHRLQPSCLIGNNHHLTPFPGEDFQMFEKDLPGENKSGLNYQKSDAAMPLETCETMNNSWGFNITDTSYKSVATLIHYLVNAAGRNANFLLNVGPMPNGRIQPEFIDTLKEIGKWMRENGSTIYGTRGSIIPPQKWGVITGKDQSLFVHILQPPKSGTFIFLPNLKEKILKAETFSGHQPVRFKQIPEGVFIYLDGIKLSPFDTIVTLSDSSGGS